MSSDSKDYFSDGGDPVLSMDTIEDGSKVLHDSLYGPMIFHPVLVSIIDTPEFQRLRNIKQLGLTYWVYPAACNNRFEHSLGVCHLAGVMIRELRRNSPVINNIITDKDILAVQIAGLCHDLGHGPLSHTWEAFLDAVGVKWKHEDASCKMLLHIYDKKTELQEVLTKDDIEFINTLIQGTPVLDPKKRFLYQIVANKDFEVDVDKWDYFERDGHSLGIKNTFDYRRLLMFCKVCEVDGSFQISFRDKEKLNITDMFRMRADLHKRAYQHRVVKTIEAMAVEALKQVNEHFTFENKDGVRFKLSEVHKDAEVFAGVTDHILWEILASFKQEYEAPKSILRRILSRKLFCILATWEICSESKTTYREKNGILKQWSEILSELNKGLKKLQHCQSCKITMTKVLMGTADDPIKNMEFYSDEGKRRFPSRLSTELDLPYCWIMLHYKEVVPEGVQQESLCRPCIQMISSFLEENHPYMVPSRNQI